MTSRLAERELSRLVDRAAYNGVLWEIDFENDFPLSTASNANEIKGRLARAGGSHTRASSATVQTKPNTLVSSGIGVDALRIGNGGYGKGAVIEESRQGIITTSSGSTWSVTGTATYAASGETGPDGSTGGTQSVSLPAINDGVWISGSGGVVSSTYTRQAWIKGTYGETITIRDASGNAGASRHTLTGEWQKITITITQTAGGSSLFLRRESGDSATSLLVWFRQIELGKFASEAIVTTGAAATRQADSLSIADLSKVVVNGQLRLEIEFVPKGARSDYDTFPTLFSYDGNNYAVFQASSGRVLTGCGGVTYTSSAGGPFVDFNAGDALKAFVGIGKCVPEYLVSVNGGAAVNYGGGSLTPAFPSSGPMGIFRTGGTQYLSGWIKRLRAYAPGRRPLWAM